MKLGIKPLPTDTKELHKIIYLQQEKIETITQQYAELQHQMLTLIRGKFGKKSEKYNPHLSGDLLAGLELPPLPEKEEQTTETEKISYTRKKKRNGHRNIPAEIPRERIEYKLTDLKCPCGCGKILYKIGEVVTEQLELVPTKLYAIQHVRFKYAGCAHEDKVITAPMPAQPIEKGLAGPGLLANVIVSKYDDHLPLYRQSEQLARNKIDISRSTLCDWVLQSADLLKPIVEHMKPGLLTSPKIHTDDTPVPLQAKGKTKTGRLWVYRSIGPPVVIYDYSPDRKKKWPERFLKNYKGYLQADAYTGYDGLYEDGNIIEVACMAHARRKFFDVDKNNQTPGVAKQALIYIGKLYAIENKIKEWDPVAKKAWRKRKAKPILKKYKKYLLQQSKLVIPKSPLGKAVNYTINHWKALTRYLANGILDIDNNKAERLMKPVAVGRKNWTFAGSTRGGHAAAIMYSLIETCKLNDINPYDYLRDVLERLPNTLMKNISELLPCNWKQNNKK